MPVTITPETEDTDFDEDDWLELSALLKPGGGDQFKIDKGQAVLVGWIDAARKRACNNFLRGYAYADVTTPYALHRVNPVRHPEMPWLYCSDVRFVDEAPTKDSDDASGYPKRASIMDGPLSGTTHYQISKVFVSFEPYDYDFVEDEGVTNEWERNVTFPFANEPSLELLTAETDRYLEWKAVTGAPTGTFPGTLSERKEETRLVLKWWNVPEDFIMREDKKYAEKIMRCVGRVNSATWNGYPKHTLRAEAPRFYRFQQQVMTDFGGGLYSYDIEIPLIYFDPSPAETSGNRDTATVLGHNLFPYVQAGGDNGPQWWPVQRADGSLFFGTVNYDTMFQSVLS